MLCSAPSLRSLPVISGVCTSAISVGNSLLLMAGGSALRYRYSWSLFSMDERRRTGLMSRYLVMAR